MTDSVRRLLTGFATAARTAWKLIVDKAISYTTAPAILNIHQAIEVQ